MEVVPGDLEVGGRLKDRVQVNGRGEVHDEGVYYIEWRENNRRLRESVPNRNQVLERARLKALELDPVRTLPCHRLPPVIRMRRVQPHARTYILTGYRDFISALEAIGRQVDNYLHR